MDKDDQIFELQASMVVMEAENTEYLRNMKQLEKELGFYKQEHRRLRLRQQHGGNSARDPSSTSNESTGEASKTVSPSHGGSHAATATQSSTNSPTTEPFAAETATLLQHLWTQVACHQLLVTIPSQAVSPIQILSHMATLPLHADRLQLAGDILELSVACRDTLLQIFNTSSSDTRPASCLRRPRPARTLSVSASTASLLHAWVQALQTHVQILPTSIQECQVAVAACRILVLLRQNMPVPWGAAPWLEHASRKAPRRLLEIGDGEVVSPEANADASVEHQVLAPYLGAALPLLSPTRNHLAAVLDVLEHLNYLHDDVHRSLATRCVDFLTTCPPDLLGARLANDWSTDDQWQHSRAATEVCATILHQIVLHQSHTDHLYLRQAEGLMYHPLRDACVHLFDHVYRFTLRESKRDKKTLHTFRRLLGDAADAFLQAAVLLRETSPSRGVSADLQSILGLIMEDYFREEDECMQEKNRAASSNKDGEP